MPHHFSTSSMVQILRDRHFFQSRISHMQDVSDSPIFINIVGILFAVFNTRCTTAHDDICLLLREGMKRNGMEGGEMK